MSSFLKLVETAKQLEEHNAEVYEIYSEITDHFGLMQLLRALRTAIAAHQKTLARFLEHKAGDVVVDDERVKAFSCEDFTTERSFDAGMEYRDFLCMIVAREERLESLYDSMSTAVLSEEHRDIFRRLSADQQKHQWLARSRMELESFSEDGCP